MNGNSANGGEAANGGGEETENPLAPVNNGGAPSLMAGVLSELKGQQKKQKTFQSARRVVDSSDDDSDDDGGSGGMLRGANGGVSNGGAAGSVQAIVGDGTSVDLSSGEAATTTNINGAHNTGRGQPLGHPLASESGRGSNGDDNDPDNDDDGLLDSVTYRAISKLAGPAMLTQIARTMSVVILYMFAARNLTREEFAGISLGLTFSNITLLTFGVGIGMVLDTVNTQQYGADPKSPRQGLYWRRAILLFVCWSIPTWISYWIFWGPILNALFGDEVGAQTLTFLKLSPLSNVPLGLLFCTQKALNAQKKVQHPMIAQVIATILVIPTCWIGSNHGVTGIGLALMVARSIGTASLFFVSWRDPEVMTTFGSWTWKEIVDKEDSVRFIKLLPHSTLICIAERWAFEGFNIMAGLLGPVHQNAYSIAISITNTLFAMAVGGYTAGNTLVGNALGQGAPHLAQVSAQKSLIFILTVTGVFAILLLLFPGVPVSLYTSDASTTKWAVSVLHVTPFMLLLDNVGYSFQGVFRACGEMGFLSVVITASHWVVSLPFAALFAFATSLKVAGIILGLVFGLAVQVAFCVRKFTSQDWQALANTAVEHANAAAASSPGGTTSAPPQEAEDAALVDVGDSS